MRSALYKGVVTHQRFVPKRHGFRYRVYMLSIDLAELDQVFSGSWLWSAQHFALGWLRRKDFLAPHDISLAAAVRKRIHEETGEAFSGRITVLANLRYFGFVMNPIVCYYCYNAEDQLQYLLAEVTNTPWREKHCYVLRCDSQQNYQHIEFAKALHVSPFMPMDMRYVLDANTPGDQLLLHIGNFNGEQHCFRASLQLAREEITPASLRRVLFGYPVLTIKICAAIYWQALRLFLKRIAFVAHPQS